MCMGVRKIDAIGIFNKRIGLASAQVLMQGFGRCFNPQSC